MVPRKRASQRKFHYIYKTTCVITGKWYIGMHSTDNQNDGYMGSGMLLWKSMKKYGKQNHLCEIVEYCENRLQLAKREEILVAEAKKNPMCLNLANGGIGFHDRPQLTESTKEKLSKASLGKPKSKEHCESIRLARLGASSSNKSKNGKQWIVTYPNGTKITVISLMRWTKENNIPNYRRLRAARPVNGFLALPVC